jgi:hypothetical protein
MAGIWFEVMVDEPRQALDRLTSRREIAGVQVFGDRLHVRMDAKDPKAALDHLNTVTQSESIAATNIRQIVPSLEDVFISEVLNRNPS